MDLAFLGSPVGTCRLMETVFNLAGAISAFASGYCAHISDMRFFQFVSMAGFILALVLIMLRVSKVVNNISIWPVIEIIVCCLWAFFYIVAASLSATWASYCNGSAAAAFFGFVAMIIYAVDCVLLLMQIKGKVTIGTTVTDGGPAAQSPAPAWTTEAPPPRY